MHFFVKIITGNGSVHQFERAPAKNLDSLVEAAFNLFDVRGFVAWPV
jgi:hypothetical protein